MELKKYQRTVIEDFDRFLNIWLRTENLRGAYHKFWEDHPRSSLLPEADGTIKPYNEDIKGTPHVCLKVPTAGGKTFIACNAIRTFFSKFPENQEFKTVVWLTPSDSILTQTEDNLKNVGHPYRMRLDVDFNGQVNIFNKKELLLNQGFTPDAIKHRLNIFVLSIDSLRARKKEDRKVYEGNGNLLSWSKLLGIDDNSEEEVFLMKVIQYLRPFVIIDESHNAVSDLSKEMLALLNPSFILDLTATPRKGANIISFVQALELKNENMVKLPVIVKNCGSKESLLAEVIDMRNALEVRAKRNPKYIRPIALIQAETRAGNSEKTFENVKKELVEQGINEDEIKIKTAEINELKGVDLRSETCQVRYIITVNALKEGWDCPFAYILASYADRSSAVDVEQILGRILRLPYTEKPCDDFLGASYVYTSSEKFDNAVTKIVEGLQASGFSSKDYRTMEDYKADEIPEQKFSNPQQGTIDFDAAKVQTTFVVAEQPKEVHFAETQKEVHFAEEPKEEFIHRQIVEYNFQSNDDKTNNPPEIQNQVAKMKAIINSKFADDIKNVKIPYFSYLADNGKLFGTTKKKFQKEILLKDFDLSTCDCSINFDDAEAEFRRIDIDEDNDEKLVVSQKMTEQDIERMLEILSHVNSDEQRLKTVARDIFLKIGNMFPLADRMVENYINKIFEHVKKTVSIEKIVRNANTYAQIIKRKIEKLETDY
ncbi:MAG: DEAD/DEAH box helicase family protein, partial [Bacteroidales bacterium]|nr:DEAD/DEAH box helicase family protein [Bacteroidales bacterium]